MSEMERELYVFSSAFRGKFLDYISAIAGEIKEASSSTRSCQHLDGACLRQASRCFKAERGDNHIKDFDRHST